VAGPADADAVSKNAVAGPAELLMPQKRRCSDVRCVCCSENAVAGSSDASAVPETPLSERQSLLMPRKRRCCDARCFLPHKNAVAGPANRLRRWKCGYHAGNAAGAAESRWPDHQMPLTARQRGGRTGRAVWRSGNTLLTRERRRAGRHPSRISVPEAAHRRPRPYRPGSAAATTPRLRIRRRARLQAHGVSR
jgi:hypothetical protein